MGQQVVPQRVLTSVYVSNVVGLKTLEKIAHLAEYLRVAKDDDTVFCTREGNIQPSRIVQKPNSLMLVTPDTAKDDVVLFTTLERVNGSHLNLLVEVLLQRAIVLHKVDDVGTLSFVRCHDADLARYNTRLEKFGHNFLNV